jgi:hypothetical protein
MLDRFPMNPERFVSADEAAKATGIRRRFLLELARQGIGGSYPLGTGLRLRNTWVFLLSELRQAIKENRTANTLHPTRDRGTIQRGSPR